MKETIPREIGYFVQKDDDDDAGILWSDFVRAIGVWSWMRPGDKPATVRETAEQFQVTDEVIRSAVKEHYWIGLFGDESDATKQYLEHDGE